MAVYALDRPGMSREERIGLAVAVAAHIGLVAWLALAPSRGMVNPLPERMTVTLSDEVAPAATALEPMAQAAPETAPTLGEAAPEPEPMPQIAPSQPTPPKPLPKVLASPLPRPTPPMIKPVPRPPPPVAKPAARTSAKGSTQTAMTPAIDTRARRRPDVPPGASRVGSDFLKGVPGGETRGTAQAPPAPRAGPQVAASLSQAISRALKPRWNAPQGAEADQLVTVLSFDLNPDGSLAGRPHVVSQTGVTDANRAQQARHAEQAIRAVQLAAPYDLPAQYYPLWKHVASFRFDRRLSQ